MNEKSQKIYLVRHGETEWSLSGQHTGLTDIPLTENGRKMAKPFAHFFAKEKPSLVLTSPLQRARMTCELAGLGKKAEIDHDLTEWNYGDYEGLTIEQIQATAPEWTVFRDGCPEGESPEQVQDRIDRVIEKIRTHGDTTAVFAHGHVLRVFVARWLGFSVEAGCHFMLDTATLNILTYYRGFPAVKQWNAPLSH